MAVRARRPFPLAVACAALTLVASACSGRSPDVASIGGGDRPEMLPPRPAPPLRLVDQRGAPFSLASLRGSPVVVFFGYTHCPDECPATLATLARAVRAPAGRAVRVVFVTVDPARDSPRALAAYLARFDPRFVGLTGSRAQIGAAAARYHVYVAPRPGRPLELEHGAPLVLIDRRGDIRGYGDPSDSARDLDAAFARDFA